MGDSSSPSFFRSHWEGYKEFWSERFSILDNYSPFVMRDDRLPSWSASDVEEFVASDPVHGPTKLTPLANSFPPEMNTDQSRFTLWQFSKTQSLFYTTIISATLSFLMLYFFPDLLKTAREAAQVSLQGGAIGAVSTAGFAWKYSRSLHGAGLAFLAGGVFGWTFGQEVASHWFQLYHLDAMAAQVKFMECWEDKNERRA